MKFIDIITEDVSEDKARKLFTVLKKGQVTFKLDKELKKVAFDVVNDEEDDFLTYEYDLGDEFKIDKTWDNHAASRNPSNKQDYYFKNCNIRILVPMDNVKINSLTDSKYNHTIVVKPLTNKAIRDKFKKFNVYLAYTMK